jgi:hypothetical protein
MVFLPNHLRSPFMKVTISTALFVLLVLPLALAAADAPADMSRTAAIAQANLPLSFEPTGASGEYVAHGGANLISVMPREAAIVVANGRNGVARTLQVAFDNANSAALIEALQPLATVTNYYVGADKNDWRLGVRNFGKLQVKDLYPGVDVVYYGNYHHLEFDFVVAPGANPGAIALSFSGADKLSTSHDGELVAQTGPSVS